MTDLNENEQILIEIPEITRVEGHCAVAVGIKDGLVTKVELDVFEGTRYFEQIVLGHQFDELPHITSRVCAICSTGHVLAAIFALENLFNVKASKELTQIRHLMHLGMIIESNATHICALALPDFFGVKDLIEYANTKPEIFKIWTNLRNLGTLIQTLIGGRPFHPINLHVGSLGKMTSQSNLQLIKLKLEEGIDDSITLANLLLNFKTNLPVQQPLYTALIPYDNSYGYFGNEIITSSGYHDSVENYHKYLQESSVIYSHAKRSTFKGQPVMVGSLARLFHFHERLGSQSLNIYKNSPMASGQHNSIYNNLAQSIEIIEAIFKALNLVENLLQQPDLFNQSIKQDFKVKAGSAVGAIECPRGTLYHQYELNDQGQVINADMITPSAQNSYRIEMDIKENVENSINNLSKTQIVNNLETLVRAYDPCNTCATHMVQVNWL